MSVRGMTYEVLWNDDANCVVAAQNLYVDARLTWISGNMVSPKAKAMEPRAKKTPMIFVVSEPGTS